ncbi:hypothetical protein [Streptomyces sp. NBC_01614]|uniref:hypothetical protein n=1 Tax=Streptomyces sp. NBC_01614 TaxID=2975897 RepID=UPI00386910DA
MNDDPQTTAVDRIPIGRNITYAVRGMPPVPNAYGPGFLVPTEVSLTYRATEDSQLGRFHAYVKGQWLRDGEVVPSGEKLPGQHYAGDPSGWPEWLAEEVRLHDPAAASAVPVAAPPTEQGALRQQVAALAEDLRYVLGYKGPRHAHERPGVWDTSGKPCTHCARLGVAQQNLAAYDADPASVLPPPADRAAVLRWAAEALERKFEGASLATIELRRLAAETPQPACDHDSQVIEHEAAHFWACMKCGTNLGRADGTPQPETQAAPDVEVVAFRSRGGRLLRCLAHHPGQEALASGDFVEVASEDLPDGGLCTYPLSVDEQCGVDVLIPPAVVQADGEA